MDILTDMLMTLAMSAWVYPLVAGLALVDALIPPVPSETIVIGAAALGAATGAPNMILLAACAALGAFAGDTLT
ncbi:MAG: DedA family protein, partial [Microbacterium gubbeenense]